MNVFLDSNIYLNFFDYSSDSLVELEKLDALLIAENLVVYLPDHVRREFGRGRERCIANGLSDIRAFQMKTNYPRFVQEYDEFGHLRDAIHQYAANVDALLARASQDIANNSLRADEVVQGLFNHANALACGEVILARARVRVDLEDPPGKKGSLGDAMIWECLLEYADNNDLYCISDDADYRSKIYRDKIKDFLADEWLTRKRGEIHFYTTLSGFLREHFPDIDIESEREKNAMISALSRSTSFGETHNIVRQLRQYDSFSDGQAKTLINTAIANDQVGWIAQDGDVADFLESLVEGRVEIFDTTDLAALRLFEGPIEAPVRGPTSGDDIPF